MGTEDLTKILKPIPLEERKIFFDEEKFVKDTLEQIKIRLLPKWEFYGVIFYNCAEREYSFLADSFEEKLKEFNLNFKRLSLIINEDSLSNLKRTIQEKDFYFICHAVDFLENYSSSLIEPYLKLDIEKMKKDDKYKKFIDNFP